MDRKKILLVEDDELLRKLYVELLSREYYVTTAIDGDDAIKMMKKDGFDAVLLDVVIPKPNGIEVIERLRKEFPSALQTKIIFLTNLDDVGIKSKLDELKYPILIKSELSPADLLEKIRKII